jgi:Spy/CpxP family protein refolding chaperone
MKKWMIISLVFLSAVLFAQEKTSPPTDSLTEKVEKLKSILGLDDAQSTKLRGIFERDRAQAEKDRATIKTGALDLIRAAYARREQTNAQIETILNPDQKEEFGETLKMTFFDRNLFEYTEGLKLTDAQAFAVEGIMIEFSNKMKEMMPDMEMDREGPPPGRMDNPGERGGPGGRGGGPGGPGGGMMKSAVKKMNKQIKALLTDEQKVLFKQIREDHAKKRKQMREEMKERRKEQHREF